MSSFDPARIPRPTFQVLAFRDAVAFESDASPALPSDPESGNGETPEPVEVTDAAEGEEASPDFVRAVEALEAAAQAICETRQHDLIAQREGIVDLALAVAHRVVDEELLADAGVRRRAIESWVEQALAELVDVRDPLRVAVSPSDLDTLREQSAIASGVVWCADANLASGQARVEAGATRVSLSLERAVASIRNRIVAALAGEETTQ